MVYFALVVIYIAVSSIMCLERTLLDPVSSSERKMIKCKVCRRLIEELDIKIRSINPAIKYKIKGYTLDDNIEHTKPVIQFRRSELFLVEAMETICKRMDDYARAHHKLTNKVDVIPLVINGEMNPELWRYNLIKDGDLESLEYYCESIMAEQEEEFLQLLQLEFDQKYAERKLCYETQICSRKQETKQGNYPAYFDEF